MTAHMFVYNATPSRIRRYQDVTSATISVVSVVNFMVTQATQ